MTKKDLLIALGYPEELCKLINNLDFLYVNVILEPGVDNVARRLILTERRKQFGQSPPKSLATSSNVYLSTFRLISRLK